MVDLARKAGQRLAYEDPTELYRYDSLDSFLSIFWLVQELLTDRDDWARIEEQAANLFTTRLYLDGSSSLTASQIASKSRRLKRKVGKLGMIVVDYLQLMEPPHLGRDSSRAEDVATMSRALDELRRADAERVIGSAAISLGVDFRAFQPALAAAKRHGFRRTFHAARPSGPARRTSRSPSTSWARADRPRVAIVEDPSSSAAWPANESR